MSSTLASAAEVARMFDFPVLDKNFPWVVGNKNQFDIIEGFSEKFPDKWRQIVFTACCKHYPDRFHRRPTQITFFRKRPESTSCSTMIRASDLIDVNLGEAMMSISGNTSPTFEPETNVTVSNVFVTFEV